MNSNLTENQLAIQEDVRRFVRDELPTLINEDNEKIQISWKAYKKIGNIGFIGLPYPNDYVNKMV